MAAIMIKPQSLLAFYIQKQQILNQTTYEKSEIIIDFSDWFINFNCGINNSIMINIWSTYAYHNFDSLCSAAQLLWPLYHFLLV